MLIRFAGHLAGGSILCEDNPVPMGLRTGHDKRIVRFYWIMVMVGLFVSPLKGGRQMDDILADDFLIGVR